MSDPTRGGTRYASDSGRSRPVVLHAGGCVFVAFMLSRGLAYFMSFTGWALRDTSSAGASGWLSLLGLGLAAGDPRFVLPALILLSLFFAAITTTHWNSADRGGVLVVALVAGVLGGAITSHWSLAVDGSTGPAVGLEVGPRADHDPFAAALYRPTTLVVARAGDALHLTAAVAGSVPGRYRLRTQVVIEGTGTALALRVREVSLPGDAAARGTLEESYDWDSLMARWRRGPRASEPVRLHCDASLTLLAADRPADAQRAARLGDEASHRASVAYVPANAR